MMLHTVLLTVLLGLVSVSANLQRHGKDWLEEWGLEKFWQGFVKAGLDNCYDWNNPAILTDEVLKQTGMMDWNIGMFRRLATSLPATYDKDAFFRLSREWLGTFTAKTGWLSTSRFVLFKSNKTHILSYWKSGTFPGESFPEQLDEKILGDSFQGAFALTKDQVKWNKNGKLSLTWHDSTSIKQKKLSFNNDEAHNALTIFQKIDRELSCNAVTIAHAEKARKKIVARQTRRNKIHKEKAAACRTVENTKIIIADRRRLTSGEVVLGSLLKDTRV